MNYYIADLHIGHENVMRHDGRPFADSAQMSMEIVSRWKRRAAAGKFALKNNLREIYLRACCIFKHNMV